MTADLIARLEGAEEGGRELQQRLLSRIEYDTNGGCWLWGGSMPAGRQQRGYVTHEGRSRLASRVSYLAFTGRDPGKGMVCHHCDTPACINPAHLYLGSQATNMADMRQRRRYFEARNPAAVKEIARRLGRRNTWAAGVRNPKAKLGEAEVAQIRGSAEPSSVLAARYGVNRSTIQLIRSRKIWVARTDRVPRGAPNSALSVIATFEDGSTKVYPSLAATKADGFRPNMVSGCINGRRKRHGGAAWSPSPLEPKP